jgi:hypothetical protein
MAEDPYSEADYSEAKKMLRLIEPGQTMSFQDLLAAAKNINDADGVNK